MVALSIGVSNMRLADAQHLFHHCSIIKGCLAQFGPIFALAACDYVVNRGKGKLLVGKMTV